MIREKCTYHQKLNRSASNISQSSNHSMTSNNSENTHRTAYTDDNESIFSGSLTPSIIVHPCNEEDDDEISSLPGTSRKNSNQFREIDSNQEEAHSLGESSNSNQNGNSRIGRKHSDVRSLRSLKTASAARVTKQQLRRVRSDMADHTATTKENVTPEETRRRVRTLLPVEEQDADERKRNSWMLPSPVHTRMQDRRSSNSVSLFATLPRQKKKSVNEADCNKR